MDIIKSFRVLVIIDEVLLMYIFYLFEGVCVLVVLILVFLCF